MWGRNGEFGKCFDDMQNIQTATATAFFWCRVDFESGHASAPSVRADLKQCVQWHSGSGPILHFGAKES